MEHWYCLQPTSRDIEPGEPVAAEIEDEELYSTPKCSYKLLPDALPSDKFTLILGNSRVSELSLSNGPVFKMCQRPETLSQTNDTLQ